ncbi:hypothetical protein [Olivibacter sitiensis]|uniref:hypothetical protein n=1 Tax=Olivibacter sitiensis TaxID=376470 RepID=UPI000486DC86|nr:hypothetical protein [Olivibacter sitiensis]
MKDSKTSISLEKAKKMRAAFTKSDARHANGGSNTRGIWFSLEHLTALVEKLNKHKDELGIDGVRFYLAKYTKENMDELDNPKYEGYTTLVHVATVKDGSGHKDYVNEAKSFSYENRNYLCPPETGCEENPTEN